MLKKSLLIMVVVLFCAVAFTQDEIIKVDFPKVVSSGLSLNFQVAFPNEDGKMEVQMVELAGVDFSLTTQYLTDVLWYIDYYMWVGYNCHELAIEKSETYNGKDDKTVYIYYGSDTHSLNSRLIYRGRALMADGYNGKKLDEYKEAQQFAKDNWQGIWKIKRK